MCFSSSPFPPALSTADLSPHLWTCFVCPALKTVKTNPKNSFQYSALKQFLCMCVCIFHTCMFHIVKEMLLIKRNSKARLKFTKKHSPRILWKYSVDWWDKLKGFGRSNSCYTWDKNKNIIPTAKHGAG